VIKKKSQNRSKYAVTLSVQTTSVKHKIIKTKWFFSNPIKADHLSQVQISHKTINSAATLSTLTTLVKYKIHTKRLILQQPYQRWPP